MTNGAWTNWVGNQSFVPKATISVDSEADVQREVLAAVEAGHGVSTAGAGHSFTPIVETDGVLLDLARLTGITNIDKDCLFGYGWTPNHHRRIWRAPLEAGICRLSNQGDIDAQAIAGAIATATHGSGRRFPNFSAVLERARVVDGTGEAIEVSRHQNADLLPAIQTSVGVLGIMTEVTIKVAPAYNLHARTDIMKLDEVMERFDSDVEEYRHFGLFWMPTDQSARLYNLDGAGADDCVVKRYREFGVDDDPPELGPHERFGPAYRDLSDGL